MAEPGTHRWVPLESNPDTLTRFVQQLTGSHAYEFYDVFTLDEPPEYIPGPVEALLLVFPITERYEAARRQQDESRENYLGRGAPAEQEDVLWFPQTISNACGTMGILHILANGTVPATLPQDSRFAALLDEARRERPLARAATVENSALVAEIHESIAQLGDTRAPEPGEDVDLHYIALVKGQRSRTIYEMDGRRTVGPIARGTLPEGEDLAGPTALAIVQEFVDAEKDNSQFAASFSLLAFAPAMA